MPTYGITPQGFVRKPLQVIVDNLNQGWRDVLGATANTDPETAEGQIIGIFSGAIDEIWTLAENAYASADVENLEGNELDTAMLALLNISRQVGESDTDFLSRGLSLNGGGSLSQRAVNDLGNIAGVTSVSIIGNDTNSVNSSGMPAKSWSVIVEGGDDLEIAAKVSRWHPAGTGLIGNTQITHTNAIGVCETTYITRPIEVPCFMKIYVRRIVTNCTGCVGMDGRGVTEALSKGIGCTNDLTKVKLAYGQAVRPSAIIASIPPSSGAVIESVSFARIGEQLSSSPIKIDWDEYATFLPENIEVKFL